MSKVKMIRSGYTWSSAPATGATITWGFRDSGTALDADGKATAFAQLTTAQMDAATEVATYASSLSNITLTQVATGGTTNSATILMAGYTSTTDGAGAYAYFPGSTATSNTAGDLWVNNRWVSTSVLPVGGYSYFVFLHEFGHAIGLSHPGDYDAAAGTTIAYGTNAQFISHSHQYSVMSYFDEAFVYDAGQDRIGDFLNDVDRLSLNSAALGLDGLSAQEVAAMATQLDTALFWDFGGGNTLTLDDWE
ncbi:MAG: protease, partial [Marivivens sp.]|nr:protease [Marivivens sp.]